MAGWLEKLEIRLNSASVEVKVEVEAELDKNLVNPITVKKEITKITTLSLVRT